MKLIIGLGNPEKRYDKTRHNAGFMIVDRLKERHAPTEPVRARFHADTIECRIAGEKVLLVKPVTYMNRSGLSVQDAARFYKLPTPEDLLVVTDDLALPVGHIRVRASGGAGGHNGLGDITRALGTQQYPRLRFGIGAKPPMMNQADYVLSRFHDEELPDLRAGIERAADAAELFVREGVAAAMNRFNEKASKPGPTESPETKAPDRASADAGVHPGWTDAGDS